LDPEQARVVQTKQVSLNRPVTELIGILTPVAQYDAAGDSSRKSLGCGGAALIVLGILALIVNTIPFHIPIALGLLAAGGAMAFVAMRKRSEDLSDNLRLCAVPFLVALREDFGAEPVELKLDLRPPLSKEKQTGKEKVDKVTTTTYVDPWMSGDGVLADGSRLRWSVVDTIIERSYWKRGSSGKQKLKTKRKKRVEIDVDLTLRAKTYNVAGEEKKQTLYAEAKVKRDTIDPIPPAEIINVIAGLYAQAAPAK
jgi:hypothetical protein